MGQALASDSGFRQTVLVQGMPATLDATPAVVCQGLFGIGAEVELGQKGVFAAANCVVVWGGDASAGNFSPDAWAGGFGRDSVNSGMA